MRKNKNPLQPKLPVEEWQLKEILKITKAKRSELFKDHDTQMLLGKFLNDGIQQLEPIYDPKVGYRYPSVETIVGNSSKAEEFLDRLYKAEILDRKLQDKIIYCPSCSSSNISVRYCCPYCKSFNIQKSSLIEHVKCGYMDVEENFRKGYGLACPKCHEELKKPDLDYRRAGIWCTCIECGKSFDIPNASHFCRECHGTFPFEDIVIKNVYSYSMKPEAKEEVSMGWVLIAPIRDLLAEKGFQIESPALLKGKSGADHLFDIVASKGQAKKKITVINLATSAEDSVSEQPVIALFAKIFDVSPDHAYLIAIPKMSENGKKMAELYNIMVIEARDSKEAVEILGGKMAN